MAEIRLNNLTKRWGQVTGVKDLNLTIADQEFLVLLGPSGCGKSTTMRMIAGLEDVTEGEIWIGERKVNTLEPKDRDISMVFQSYGLYPNMSVYENIRFPLKVRKVPKGEHHDRVMRAAGMVHLTDFLDRRPAELSGGQRQRVALGRAIVREPTVFLMDEPLSNLDAKLRVSTRAEIKNLQYQLKTTTIYVTHDQIEAMTLADRVVVMDGGVVQQVATPTEMYENPANTFVAGFIGSPAMNLVDGEIRDGTFRARNIEIAGLPDVASGRVTLGFRAEDVVLTDTGGEIDAPAFAVELLGEMTMIAAEAGPDLVNLKADKNFRAKMGEPVHASLDPRRCHLFDAETGQRLTERTRFDQAAAG